MYAILRHGKKLKTAGELRAVGLHNDRRRSVPSADQNRLSLDRIIVGTGHPEKDVTAMIEERGIRPRRNAVLAMELLLTSSPEYFRPNGEEPGQWDDERMRDWLTRTRRWLDEEFPDQVASVHLHLSEATPHVHVIVCPRVLKTRKRKKQPDRVYWTLDAKGVLGGPDDWRGRQDRYAKALADLGLRRGMEGSKARHASPLEQYKKLEANRRVARSSMLKNAMNEGKSEAFATIVEILTKEAQRKEREALKHLTVSKLSLIHI